MLILVAIILGIIEGLTEFLPVSSTGHLILVGHALDFTGAKAATFEIFIQLGAILAILWLYHHRFRQLLTFSDAKGLQGKRGLMLLGLTTLPALVVGFLAHGLIKEYLFQPLTVAIGLFIGGIVIIIFESVPHKFRTVSLDDITPRQAFGIGCAQLIAMWPGVSRSGSTIIGGVLSGLDRKTAVEYSFLAAVPVMIAATGYDLLKSVLAGAVRLSDAPLFAVGFVTAFVAASLAVRFLVGFVERFSFKPFGYYRIIVAILVVIFLV